MTLDGVMQRGALAHIVLWDTLESLRTFGQSVFPEPLHSIQIRERIYLARSSEVHAYQPPDQFIDSQHCLHHPWLPRLGFESLLQFWILFAAGTDSQQLPTIEHRVAAALWTGQESPQITGVFSVTEVVAAACLRMIEAPVFSPGSEIPK
jgi:hypothetical protein